MSAISTSVIPAPASFWSAWLSAHESAAAQIPPFGSILVFQVSLVSTMCQPRRRGGRPCLLAGGILDQDVRRTAHGSGP